MSKEQAVEEKIKATLESLQGIRRASPGAFFFTRLMATLNSRKRNIWEAVTYFIAKPVIAIALCMVVLINAIVVFEKEEAVITPTEQTDIADEYTAAVTPIFDYENP